MNQLVVDKAFAKLDPNQSLGEGIEAGFSSVGYRGKVWSLRHQGERYPFVRPDDGTPLSYLDVIIVGVAPTKSRAYYPGVFDEDSSQAPVCRSLRSDAPDPGSPEPQSKTCATCKHSEWITKQNGSRGQECQEHKRLAVLLMPATTAKMMGAPLLEPVYLKIPPGSLRTLKSYGDSLVHQGIPYASVITRISFAPEKLFRMEFKALKALTAEEAPLVLPMTQDPQTKVITGETPISAAIEYDSVEAPPPVEIDTGIMAAFAPKTSSPGGAVAAKAEVAPAALPARRGPGRPKKAEQAAAGVSSGKGWTETDEFDAEVTALLNQKVAGMLK